MGIVRSIATFCFLLALLLSVGENEAIGNRISASEEELVNVQGMHGATQDSLKPEECGPRCTSRCSATAYKKQCLFFCQKCCAKCLCVPPGTYRNKQFCPRYKNWKTTSGRPKCP